MENNSIAFSVDLSQVSGSTESVRSGLEHAQRVRERVRELIKPGVNYSILDTDGDPVGSIGAESKSFNLDEDTEEGYSDVEGAGSIEELERGLFDLDVKEAILNLIDHPARGTNWDGTPMAQDSVERYRDWIKEQRGYEAATRAELAEEAELEANLASQCNGYLNTVQGVINHRGICPIHGMSA